MRPKSVRSRVSKGEPPYAWLAPMALLIVEAILGIKNLLLGSNPLEVSKTSESKFRNGNQKQKIQAIGPLFYIEPL